jgi:membrane peptidoglycan carboxypeptidase
VVATASDAVVNTAPWILAAKTGTTDGGRDAWLAGFLMPTEDTGQKPIQPRVTVVLWAGYDDNRAAGLYGGKIHGPIFGRFLRDARVWTALHALLQEKP